MIGCPRSPSLLLAACVPDPTNRPIPSGGDAAAAADADADPDPGRPDADAVVRPSDADAAADLLRLHGRARATASTRSPSGSSTTARSIAYWNRATYPSLDPESGSYRPNDIKVGWTLALIPKPEVDPENLPTLPRRGAEPGGSPSERRRR